MKTTPICFLVLIQRNDRLSSLTLEQRWSVKGELWTPTQPWTKTHLGRELENLSRFSLCQMVFTQDRHEDVLDLCLVQFEPDSSEYIRVRWHWASWCFDPITTSTERTQSVQPWNFPCQFLYFPLVIWYRESNGRRRWFGSFWISCEDHCVEWLHSRENPHEVCNESPPGIQVHAAAYEDLEKHGKYELLSSTRHFGGLAWYLVRARRVDGLIVDMLKRELWVCLKLISMNRFFMGKYRL